MSRAFSSTLAGLFGPSDDQVQPTSKQNTKPKTIGIKNTKGVVKAAAVSPSAPKPVSKAARVSGRSLSRMTAVVGKIPSKTNPRPSRPVTQSKAGTDPETTTQQSSRAFSSTLSGLIFSNDNDHSEPQGQRSGADSQIHVNKNTEAKTHSQNLGSNGQEIQNISSGRAFSSTLSALSALSSAELIEPTVSDSAAETKIVSNFRKPPPAQKRGGGNSFSKRSIKRAKRSSESDTSVYARQQSGHYNDTNAGFKNARPSKLGHEMGDQFLNERQSEYERQMMLRHENFPPEFEREMRERYRHMGSFDYSREMRERYGDMGPSEYQLEMRRRQMNANPSEFDIEMRDRSMNCHPSGTNYGNAFPHEMDRGFRDRFDKPNHAPSDKAPFEVGYEMMDHYNRFNEELRERNQRGFPSNMEDADFHSAQFTGGRFNGRPGPHLPANFSESSLNGPSGYDRGPDYFPSHPNREFFPRFSRGRDPFPPDYDYAYGRFVGRGSIDERGFPMREEFSGGIMSGYVGSRQYESQMRPMRSTRLSEEESFLEQQHYRRFSGSTPPIATEVQEKNIKKLKKPKKDASTKGALFCCSICNVSMTSQDHLDAHLSGKKHLAAVRNSEGEFNCSLCQVSFCTAKQLVAHGEGAKHLEALKAWKGTKDKTEDNKSDKETKSESAVNKEMTSREFSTKRRRYLDYEVAMYEIRPAYWCNGCDRHFRDAGLLANHAESFDHRRGVSELGDDACKLIPVDPNLGPAYGLGSAQIGRLDASENSFYCFLCQVEIGAAVDIPPHVESAEHREREVPPRIMEIDLEEEEDGENKLEKKSEKIFNENGDNDGDGNRANHHDGKCAKDDGNDEVLVLEEEGEEDEEEVDEKEEGAEEDGDREIYEDDLGECVL